MQSTIVVKSNDCGQGVIGYHAGMVTPALPQVLTQHAGYLAVLMGQRAQAAFETALQPLDLVPQQFDYLATVLEGGPVSQRELARTLNIDPARVVAVTDDLEGRGLVTRSVDPTDRRRNLVGLTRSGRALVGRASRAAVLVERELLRDLSAADKDRLRALLRTVVRHELEPG